jgi:alpha-glucosidase (family GH31 glycosyl hydrolase)
MEVFSPEGIHFGFLQPWSQVCSWAYWRHPWLLGDRLGAIFKSYARLRYRLLPYIYSMAHVASRTGMPIMRAMPLAFPGDPRSDELIHQYLFGDWFLTGAFVETIHLPEGRWVDYWTGATWDGPRDLPCEFPEERGGPLFVKAGAILPEWPEMDYVGQRPVEALGLDVYPHGESAFTLFEDDGISLEYLKGAVARTDLRSGAGAEGVTLTLGVRKGRYDGMPGDRRFEVRVHAGFEPSSVTVNGDFLPRAVENGWRWDHERAMVRLSVKEDAARKRDAVVRILR